MMAMQAMTPSAQLHPPPIHASRGVPPINSKRLSIGATVSPRMTHQAAPL